MPTEITERGWVVITNGGIQGWTFSKRARVVPGNTFESRRKYPVPPYKIVRATRTIRTEDEDE